MTGLESKNISEYKSIDSTRPKFVNHRFDLLKSDNLNSSKDPSIYSSKPMYDRHQKLNLSTNKKMSNFYSNSNQQSRFNIYISNL